MFKSVFLIAISTLVLGTTVGTALGADAKTELTSQERAEMRQRAEKLIAEREREGMPVKSAGERSSRSKKKTQH